MIQPKLRFVEANALLFNCIQLIAAPGHTPGHIILRIFSGDQELVHIADTIHSEVLLFRHPEWGFIFDVDFEQAIATRTSILKTLEQNKTLTLAYHLPWPGLGYVRYKNSAFEWEVKAEVISNMV
jgi:glyoxylase-like metal-dependent hydrolase (beta-lactamase superfamily II)